MKKLTLISIGILGSSFSLVASNSLITDAKKAGLKPIPQNCLAKIQTINNPNNPLTKAKKKLGKKLYFDPRLSKSGLISCNTCHNLATGGDDNIPVAVGHKWTKNPHHLNSPTVYNAVFAKRQFWDGRSPDLEDQATGPIQAKPEMNMHKDIAVKVIKSIPEYVKEFKKAYPNEEITIKTIGKAIAAFERTLVTPSRFDNYLHGDENALTQKEKEGLKTFIKVGCASCHNGIALGGSMQPFPVVKPYKYANIGDFKGDKNHMVKTPTLRNITQTAPYFHNGAVWSLKEAVKIMGETQLGKELSDNEITSIVTFLKSLEGKKPKIDYPMLPNSTKDTPKPSLD